VLARFCTNSIKLNSLALCVNSVSLPRNSSYRSPICRRLHAIVPLVEEIAP
jgi:hypothetical protein